MTQLTSQSNREEDIMQVGARQAYSGIKMIQVKEDSQ